MEQPAGGDQSWRAAGADVPFDSTAGQESDQTRVVAAAYREKYGKDAPDFLEAVTKRRQAATANCGRFVADLVREHCRTSSKADQSMRAKASTA